MVSSPRPHRNQKVVKSPLRYPGAKAKVWRQILSEFPPANSIREYREPFVGGGSVFFAFRSGLTTAYADDALDHAADQQQRSYWLNDLYYELYCYMVAARDRMPKLLDVITDYRTAYSNATGNGNGRALYNLLKLKSGDEGGDEFERAVRYFILNRITFSGLADAGGYSQYNFENRFTLSSIQRLAKIETLLQGVRLTNCDYESLLTAPGKDVLIFADPPYLNATQSKLYGRRGELHTGFDHERFAYNMERCPHRWLITYDDTPLIRKLFSFASAKVSEWQVQYSINNVGRESAVVGNELFIRNY
jgi:DNA adenine methylase